jgi:lactoylglutathione lyase
MRIEHIALWCKDLEAMRAFYERFFGARSTDKYLNPAKGFASYFLSFDSGARLELMYMPSVPETANDPHLQATGWTHLAISVGSEGGVDAMTAALKDAGYEVIYGPRRTGDGYYESTILDPEGNRLEITE